MRVRILSSLCVAAAALGFVLPAQGQLIITEFMASNTSTLRDEDNAYSDWIEIYNTASTNVDAGGWFLTDDSAQLTRWQFPPTNIAPHSFIIVFASGKNRAVTGAPLHANFSLGADGEYLALVKPDGATIATQFAAEAQFPNISYGFLMTGVPQVLLGSPAPTRALVPSSDLGTSWRNIHFDDSSWLSGNSAVGYDFSTNYLPAIGLDVGAGMSNVNASAFARFPFQVANPEMFRSLQLRMRYDDGFVAYLNGTEVLRRNAPASPQWNSTATGNHGPPAAGSLLQDFDSGVTNYTVHQHATVPGPSVQPAAAGTTGNYLRLMSDNVNEQFNSVAFRQTAPGLFEKITTEFDFRITDTANNPADGFAFLLLPTSIYGTNGPGVTTQVGGIEKPNYAGVFSIGFDVYPHATANDVSVHWNGAERLNVSMPRATLEMVAGQFHRAHITLQHVTGGARVSVSFIGNINGSPSAPYTPITNFFVPDLNAYDCRIQFAGRTGGANMGVDLDNINVQFIPPPALVAFEDFDITPHLGLLTTGSNVLAVHGLNLSAANEDFIIEPQIIGADFLISTQVNHISPPTPGSWNNVNAAGTVSAVTFWPPSGTYGSNEITISMASASSSAQIRYTFNGTTPNEGSFLYTGPITIPGTVTVRARAFEPGRIESEVKAANYVLISSALTNFTSNLPLIIIDTLGGNIVADNRIAAYATILETNTATGRTSFDSTPNWRGRIAVELKGQSSLGFPKNSMNVELNTEGGRDKSDPVLGMPAGSDWVLYAPYTDKTLMNDYLTFELHEAMGHYAVRRRFVEVFVRTTAQYLTTNEYRGVFVFLEKIRIDNDRVDISEPQSGAPGDPITGGYIWKKDKGSPGDIEFTTLYQSGTIAANGSALQYHDPDGTDLTSIQRSWLTNYLNEFETVLYGPNWRDPRYGYRNYISIDSFVDQHWAVEFPKNIDGYRLSNYLYKDRGEKMHMEPIWDWNLSWGNANYLEGGWTNGWYHTQLGSMEDYFLSRLRTDPDFYQKIIDRWGQLRTNVYALSNLLARVDAITNLLAEAQVREFQRWPRLNAYVWPNPDGANLVGTDGTTATWHVNYATPGTYAALIGEMKKWIVGRHAWIDSRWLPSPSLSRAGGQITNGTTVNITAPLGTIYYTLDGTDPRAPGGAVSSSAQVYSGTITLSNNAGVMARAFMTNGWSAPAAAVYVVETPKLAITEIMYHPQDVPTNSVWTESDFEFIEIKNTGTSTLNLQGARLGGGLDFTFLPNVLLPTGLPTSNSFDGSGTAWFGTNLNSVPAPVIATAGSSGDYLKLMTGGATNLTRNRATFAQTASGAYGRVISEFDFRASTVASEVTFGEPTLQNFEGGGTPYTNTGSALLTAPNSGSTGSFMRLVPAVNSLVGGLGLARSATGAWNTVIATFDFRVTPGTGQADGMAFALLNTANFGTNGVPPAFGEEPNLAGSIGIGLDVYSNGEVNNNHVSLHWNGAIVGAPATPNFDISNGRFHRAQLFVRFSGGRGLVTMRITPDINGTPGTPVTLFQDAVINGVNPYEMRAAFAARTGGENAAHDVDNVDIQFSTETGTSAGVSMLLLTKNSFGTNGLGTTLTHYSDAPSLTNAFALDFVFHPSNYVNDAVVYWNGVNLGGVTLPAGMLDLDNGIFHRVRVVLDAYVGGSYATISITPDIHGTPGAPIIIASNLFITGLLPADARLEFAGRNGMIDTTVDLDNVLMTHEVFQSLLLAPGECILVVKNRAAFESLYGTGHPIAGEFTGSLNNAGDHIVLYGPVGEVILDFTYSDDWYRISDGLGFSLVNRDPNTPAANYNSPNTWRNSTYQGGSPGALDPVLNIAPVVVNELLANSVPPDMDWIELHNPTTNTVDIGGWFITDDFTVPKKFRVPDNTTIAPGAFILFEELDFNSTQSDPRSFAFGSDGDEVWLFSGDANTNLTGYVHGYDYGASDEGVTFGRILDSLGDEHFVAQIVNTPGATNAGPRVGPVVISEIMYRPPDVGTLDNDLDEYIELHNISANTVELFSAALPTDTWQLREAVEFAFPQSVSLAAGERALVVGFNPTNTLLLTPFRERFGISPAVQIFGPWSGKLNNSGEDVELRRPLAPGTNGTPYALVDKVDYADKAPWPRAADGYGPSLHRLDSAVYGNDAGNWTAASATPGAAFSGGDAPAISQQPVDDAAMLGESASFTVTATGPALQFQWRRFGTNIPGATNATLTLENLQVAEAGAYHAAIYNGGGSTLSAEAFLSVVSPVVIIEQPQGQQVASGSNVTLSVTAVGNGTLTYQWRFEGNDIPDATNATYAIVGANLNQHHGNFSVQVTDDVSTVVSSNALIYVRVNPGIVQHLTSQTVLQGGSVTFTVIATGAPPLGYRWVRDFGQLPALFTSEPTLTITNVQKSGNIRVVVTNLASFGGTQSPQGAPAQITMLSDFDQDGVADVWEAAYFGATSTNNAGNATEDADGDTMSNRDEYLAGTNPTNALSLLKVVFSETNGTVITFVAQTNKTYSVQVGTNLSAAPVWMNLSNVTSSPQVRTIQVNTATAPGDSERYFRIVTPLVP